jgi:hypothetical protein
MPNLPDRNTCLSPLIPLRTFNRFPQNGSHCANRERATIDPDRRFGACRPDFRLSSPFQATLPNSDWSVSWLNVKFSPTQFFSQGLVTIRQNALKKSLPPLNHHESARRGRCTTLFRSASSYNSARNPKEFVAHNQCTEPETLVLVLLIVQPLVLVLLIVQTLVLGLLIVQTLAWERLHSSELRRGVNTAICRLHDGCCNHRHRQKLLKKNSATLSFVGSIRGTQATRLRFVTCESKVRGL